MGVHPIPGNAEASGYLGGGQQPGAGAVVLGGDQVVDHELGDGSGQVLELVSAEARMVAHAHHPEDCWLSG
jgi:hypothetical protein